MKAITFFDTEIEPRTKKIVDIGAVKSDGSTFHSPSVSDFANFLENTEFIGGHNILRHDLNYLGEGLHHNGIDHFQAIDTLFLSPLLFPQKPYHRLLKDDKLQSGELNNPVADSINARDLFFDEVTAFEALNADLKAIYHLLLHQQPEFHAFYTYLSFVPAADSIRKSRLIQDFFSGKICANASVDQLTKDRPVELAYCLALIHINDRYSITPPWLLMNYPDVDHLMYLLRGKPCTNGCKYCNDALDATKGLKRFFGFDAFRTFAGEPLQEKAINATIQNKSLLAVFPTGGGKSLTFQLPALMEGENTKGLTVVISPLQALMKDQVDNLEKIGITDAVTINGLLDPIERGKSFERVEAGSASILYISPESLRSKSIEKLLLGRRIAHFVIDEAHCFSSWGQDFRVDYLYIADFIKQLQAKKNLTAQIPVSCFTATAKQKVIEDISQYFKQNLSLHLEIFRANATRTNLQYKVFDNKDEEEKYNHLRTLIQSRDCPAIVYVSRTKKANDLAKKLTHDGFSARAYHGKMDVKDKTENQNAFIVGDVQIMVATSAFGMGVDKKDVGQVIHYDISDSLENYVQEAGRAGRDENIMADCYVLFNEEDLHKHFVLLNQTKLSVKEIQQVWRAIKEITRFRSTVSNSALEIARKAGWDDNVMDIETRVKTAIAALEQAGYLKRGQNIPRIFASSILTKNAEQAIAKINNSPLFDEQQKVKAARIIRKLFSAKSRHHATDEAAESRVDYISDHLGIVKEEVIRIISLMREEKILADTKDLTAFIKQGNHENPPLNSVKTFAKLENFLLTVFKDFEKTYHLKELNEAALEAGCRESSPEKIKTILNFWATKNWIKQKRQDYSNHHLSIILNSGKEDLIQKQEKRHLLAQFIIKYLFKKSREPQKTEGPSNADVLIEFSVHELKEHYQQKAFLFNLSPTIEDIEDTLFYLSRIDALKIEGGFLVIYNKLTIDRLEQNGKIQYKNDDYRQLEQFYQSKVEQIHIVGEYARKMLEDYEKALRFVDDYFQLNYTSFLTKYFPGSRANELNRNITPGKFRELFGELSARQLDIINDHQSSHIVVAAGPGSGKTKVLVHKLASLVLMEDVKYEQMLMLTFSRAATTEFRKRLIKLIGNAALYIEMKTFHSYCFDLLGRVGSLEKTDTIIQIAVQKINSGEVEPNRIIKKVLVIDEAQDMNTHEFELVRSLMDKNEAMRVIAVGDDDQNIYTFRGADSAYFEQLVKEPNAQKYELTENYRSKENLVAFTNRFVETIRHRFKTTPILSKTGEGGKVIILHHRYPHLFNPLIKDILSSELTGTTAVLTKTNHEALQITGLLLKNNMPARQTESNEGFNLFNLLEVRTFWDFLHLDANTPTISPENWDQAKLKFRGEHHGSKNYELCIALINDFEQTHPKIKFRFDFEGFIRESKMEQFLNENTETISVSTIHKAKGKEFDNLFLLLDGNDAINDDRKRELYVAMTRAKTNLTIHVRGSCLDDITTPEAVHIYNDEVHQPPSQLVYHLTHKDIYLGYFGYINHRVNRLVSGHLLGVNGEQLTNEKGEAVVKFSKSFSKQKEALEKDGFVMKTARVNYVVYWTETNEETGVEKEVKVVLPEVVFYLKTTHAARQLDAAR